MHQEPSAKSQPAGRLTLPRRSSNILILKRLLPLQDLLTEAEQNNPRDPGRAPKVAGREAGSFPGLDASRSAIESAAGQLSEAPRPFAGYTKQRLRLHWLRGLFRTFPIQENCG